jgi:hypothetical protein
MLETLAIFSNVQPQLQPHYPIHPVANIVVPRVGFEPVLKRTFNKMQSNGRQF